LMPLAVLLRWAYFRAVSHGATEPTADGEVRNPDR